MARQRAKCHPIGVKIASYPLNNKNFPTVEDLLRDPFIMCRQILALSSTILPYINCSVRNQLHQGCELELELEPEKLGYFAKLELEKIIFLNSNLNSNKIVRVH